MNRWGVAGLVIAVALAGVAAFLLLSGGPGAGDLEGTTCGERTVDYDVLSGDEGYDWTTVGVDDRNGTQLGTVDVRIADTPEKRFTGLSDTETLPDDEGMLFVHAEEGQQTYVMRDMDFPLDIVFVASNGTITTIHHAPVPEEIDDGNGRFPGTARYVLEVERGWTNATGTDPGDCVAIPSAIDDDPDGEGEQERNQTG